MRLCKKVKKIQACKQVYKVEKLKWLSLEHKGQSQLSSSRENVNYDKDGHP